MISVYYVFLDEENEWLTHESGATSTNWHDACEFHDETKVKIVAERLGGVVFGWVQ